MKPKLFIVLLSFISIQCFAKTKNNEDIHQFIAAIFNPKNNVVKTKNCQIDKKNWSLLLLTQKSFREEIKFNKQCDFEGSFNPKMADFFPIKLLIKDHPKYNKVESLIKIEILFTNEAILKITTKNSKFTGKNQLDFHLHYSIAIDPLNSKKFISKRLGGKLFITQIDKKVIKKEFTL